MCKTCNCTWLLTQTSEHRQEHRQVGSTTCPTTYKTLSPTPHPGADLGMGNPNDVIRAERVEMTAQSPQMSNGKPEKSNDRHRLASQHSRWEATGLLQGSLALSYTLCSRSPLLLPRAGGETAGTLSLHLNRLPPTP